MKYRIVPLFTVACALVSSPASVHGAASEKVASCEVRLDSTTAVNAAQARASEIMARKGKLQATLLNPWTAPTERRHAEQWSIRGIPETVTVAPAAGRVFRHYIEKEKAFRDITASGTLLPGPFPYVQVSPAAYRKMYWDLTGVFLTLPGVDSYDVGLRAKGNRYYYVDVQLPEKMPVFQIEKQGAIYLVPLKADLQEWIQEAYRNFKATGQVSDESMKNILLRIDSEGGIPQVTPVPIHIVRSGQQ